MFVIVIIAIISTKTNRFRATYESYRYYLCTGLADVRHYQWRSATLLHCIHFVSEWGIVFVRNETRSFRSVHRLNQRSKFKLDDQSDSLSHTKSLIFFHVDNRIDSDWINEQWVVEQQRSTSSVAHCSEDRLDYWIARNSCLTSRRGEKRIVLCHLQIVILQKLA